MHGILKRRIRMSFAMDLVAKFHEYVSQTIDEDGIYPFPGMSINKDGKMKIAALRDSIAAFDWFWNQITIEQSKECIFGFDRFTGAGQGTEFSDVLACAHWAEGMDGKGWYTSFRIGVINYQHEPRIVREFDFSNEYWTSKMTREVMSFNPKRRIVVNSLKPPTNRQR